MKEKKYIYKKRVMKNFSRAKNYDRHTSYHNISLQKSIPWISGYFNSSPFLNILDAGCGTAKLYEILAHENIGKFNYFGLDFAYGLLKEARLKTGGKAHLVCADAENLPFREGVLDIIVSNMTLHWLPSPERFLEECRLALKEDGILIISFLAEGTLKELFASAGKISSLSDIGLFDFPEITLFSNKIPAAGFKILAEEAFDFVEKDRSALKLLKKMNNIGAKNPLNRDSLKPNLLKNILREYDRNYMDEDGMVYATYKIAFLILKKGTI